LAISSVFVPGDVGENAVETRRGEVEGFDSAVETRSEAGRRIEDVWEGNILARKSAIRNGIRVINELAAVDTVAVEEILKPLSFNADAGRRADTDTTAHAATNDDAWANTATADNSRNVGGDDGVHVRVVDATVSNERNLVDLVSFEDARRNDEGALVAHRRLRTRTHTAGRWHREERSWGRRRDCPVVEDLGLTTAEEADLGLETEDVSEVGIDDTGRELDFNACRAVAKSPRRSERVENSARSVVARRRSDAIGWSRSLLSESNRREEGDQQ